MRLRIGIVAVLVAIGIAGCGSSGGGSAAIGSGSTNTITVGVVPKAVTINYYKQTDAGAVCAASRLKGVKTIVEGPTGVDIPGQINMLRDLMTKQVNALDFAAQDAQALEPVAAQAQAEKVKAVTFDSGVSPQGQTPLFATNNVLWAKNVADRMAKALGSAGGQVALIHFNPGSQTDNQRAEGFIDGVKAHPKLKLVAQQNGNAQVQTGLSVVTNILSSHPNLKAIFASDETSTVGAALAVRRAGKVGKVLVFGWDAAPDDLKELKEGLVNSLVVQNPFKMGYDSLQAAVTEVRTGKTVHGEDTGATIVTKANLNTPAVKNVLAPACATYKG